MGGQDKGLMHYRQQPLVAWVAQGLRPQVAELIISANRNLAAYAAYADALVSDAEPGYLGPLAGVLAGLARAQHTWLLCAPCDMPGLTPRVYHVLLQQGYAAQRPVVAHDGVRVQPTLSLFPVAARLALQAQWAAGERSLHRALASLQPVYVTCDVLVTLGHCNTPADLRFGASNHLA